MQRSGVIGDGCGGRRGGWGDSRVSGEVGREEGEGVIPGLVVRCGVGRGKR